MKTMQILLIFLKPLFLISIFWSYILRNWNNKDKDLSKMAENFPRNWKILFIIVSFSFFLLFPEFIAVLIQVRRKWNEFPIRWDNGLCYGLILLSLQFRFYLGLIYFLWMRNTQTLTSIVCLLFWEAHKCSNSGLGKESEGIFSSGKCILIGVAGRELGPKL